jgi:hypothetical protein
MPSCKSLRRYQELSDQKNEAGNNNCKSGLEAELELEAKQEAKYSSRTIINKEDMDIIRRCFVTGLFFHAAERQPDRSYKTISDNLIVHIHPSSVLSNVNRPSENGKSGIVGNTGSNSNNRTAASEYDCILYNEQICSTKQYVRDVMAIEKRWLPELVPQFYGKHQMGSQQIGNQGLVSAPTPVATPPVIPAKSAPTSIQRSQQNNDKKVISPNHSNKRGFVEINAAAQQQLKFNKSSKTK